jgi:LPXTG-site transpeptidase (sortase) family protein
MKWTRLFWTLVIVLGLFAIWHSSLLLSLLRPTLIKQDILSDVVVDQEQDNQIAYGSLGIKAPLSIDAETSPLVQSDWSAIRLALLQGVSLSYQSENFATASLAFITGHSSDTTKHPYDSVFASLGQAEVDDVFTVNVEQTKYEYRVISKQQIAPSASDVFEDLAPTDSSHRVALVTCWPPLTTKMRMVVVGQRLD